MQLPADTRCTRGGHGAEGAGTGSGKADQTMKEQMNKGACDIPGFRQGLARCWLAMFRRNTWRAQSRRVWERASVSVLQLGQAVVRTEAGFMVTVTEGMPGQRPLLDAPSPCLLQSPAPIHLQLLAAFPCSSPSPPSSFRNNNWAPGTNLGCGDSAVEVPVASAETTGTVCVRFWAADSWVETELGREIGSGSSAASAITCAAGSSIFSSPAMKSECTDSAGSVWGNSKDCIGASLTVFRGSMGEGATEGRGSRVERRGRVAGRRSQTHCRTRDGEREET